MVSAPVVSIPPLGRFRTLRRNWPPWVRSPTVPMRNAWLPKPRLPTRWRSESSSLLVWVRMTVTKPLPGLPRLRKPMAIWNTFATCWVSVTGISVNPAVWSTIKKMVAKPAGSGIIHSYNQTKVKK